jgi:A/G-specific adenine glycosylase
MLQQTQVATVVPYFEKFLARFPTVETLAQAPLEDVLLHWAGLGYYSRARNIHRGAQQIVERGGFPNTRDGWLAIPGVGNYTAGAILSIASNQPEAILDGNVERVLSRVRRVTRRGGDSFYKARLWRLSRICVEQAHRQKIAPSVTNQALMELGATLCSPRNPKCLLCPVGNVCRAREAGDAESLPVKKKPKTWIDVREELHCVIGEDGSVLLRKREKGEWRAGLWDLLGDLSSEIPPSLREGLKPIGDIQTRHIVTRHKITRTTHVWRMEAGEARVWSAAERAATREDFRWVNPQAPAVAIGSALKKTLLQIRETFPEAWLASSELESASSRSD